MMVLMLGMGLGPRPMMAPTIDDDGGGVATPRETFLPFLSPSCSIFSSHVVCIRNIRICCASV